MLWQSMPSMRGISGVSSECEAGSLRDRPFRRTGGGAVKGIQAPRGGWTAILLVAVLLAVEAVIVAESWRGLVGFAHLIGITGPTGWGVPVTLDGVSLVAALVALRAELAGEASGLYRVTLFAFTAASCAANYWHGRAIGGEQAALYLGGMSVAVAVVFSLALRQIRHEDRRRAGTMTGRLPRFSAAHWARYPGLTWRAWSLAVRDGHASPRAALDAVLAERLPAHRDRLADHPGEQSGERAGRSPRARGKRARTAPVTAEAVEEEFMAELLSGAVPSLRQIRSRMHVGPDRAKGLRAHLDSAVRAQQNPRIPERQGMP
jgi:hypothetical protein